MKYLKLFEDIDFDESDWDYEEFEEESDFTYVMGAGQVYISFGEDDNDNVILFNGIHTSGWKPSQFIPLTDSQLNEVKNGRSIDIYDRDNMVDGEINNWSKNWKSVTYENLIKIYPQFRI